MEKTEKLTNSALLVIDVQRGLFDQSVPIYNAEVLLKNINLLVSKAKVHQIPMIDKWNQNLSKLGAKILKTNEIDFHSRIS